MARLIWTAIVMGLMTIAGQPSRADDLSLLFDGLWTGNGTIRPQSFDAPERARCKVSGTRLVDNTTQFSGRCATVSGSGSFKMEIRKIPGTERYEIEAQLPDQVQPVRMRGTADGRILRFSLLKPIKQRGRMLTGQIRIIFPENDAMDMTQSVTDVSTGEQAETVSMTFKRRLE